MVSALIVPPRRSSVPETGSSHFPLSVSGNPVEGRFGIVVLERQCQFKDSSGGQVAPRYHMSPTRIEPHSNPSTTLSSSAASFPTTKLNKGSLRRPRKGTVTVTPSRCPKRIKHRNLVATTTSMDCKPQQQYSKHQPLSSPL